MTDKIAHARDSICWTIEHKAWEDSQRLTMEQLSTGRTITLERGSADYKAFFDKRNEVKSAFPRTMPSTLYRIIWNSLAHLAKEPA